MRLKLSKLSVSFGHVNKSKEKADSRAFERAQHFSTMCFAYEHVGGNICPRPAVWIFPQEICETSRRRRWKGFERTREEDRIRWGFSRQESQSLNAYIGAPALSCSQIFLVARRIHIRTLLQAVLSSFHNYDCNISHTFDVGYIKIS